MDNGIRLNATNDGWNSLTLRLGEEDGTMTVDARREDDRVAINVAFSDPNLRATAAQQIDRLEAALRAHYETTVDLSLGDNGTSQQHDGKQPERHLVDATTDSELRTHRSAVVARAAMSGATHEWIG